MKIRINKEYMEVYKAKGEPEAYIIKGLLEENGIPCFLRSRSAPSVLFSALDGFSEVKILVKAEDSLEALKLIEGDNNA
jgi:hypothetical protein